MHLLVAGFSKRVNPWVAAFISVTCMMAVAALFVAAEFAFIYLENVRESHAALGLIQADTTARRAEIFSLIDRMEAMNLQPCGAAFRRATQSVIIRSKVADDIVALDARGNIVCSSIYDLQSSTLLMKPKRPSPPVSTLENGVGIIRGLRFTSAPDRSFTLFVKKNLGVLAHAYDPPSDATRSYRWLSSVDIDRRNRGILTYRGPRPDMSIADMKDGAARRSGADYRVVACADDGSFCHVLTTSLSGLARASDLTLALFGLIGALIGGLVSVRILLWLYRRQSLTERLRRAIRQESLFLLYQPIVDADANAIVAFEALMRWSPKTGNAIPPDVFVPAAEQSGLIHDLTCLAIKIVSRDMKAVLERHPTLTVSINIVIADLGDPRFHKAIADHLIGCGIAPRRIAFEITERSDADMETSIDAIHDLKRQGFRFYIDDFGTGYSSIANLTDIPVDAIKIDKSFTQTIGTDAARARLVEPMLQMIRDMEIPMIVEGVENDVQRRFFRDHGAQRMQGWLIGKPMPAHDVEAFVTQAAGSKES